MKKVLFLLNHFQYSDGVAKVLVDICNSLDPCEYQITVKSFFRYDREFIKLFNSNIRVETVFGFYFKGMSTLVRKIPMNLLYKFVTKGEKFDIEIAFQYGISTELISQSNNKLATHVAWMHTYDDGLLFRDCYEKMDRVVCVSKCNSERLRKETNGKVNAIYCYNLVDDYKLKKLSSEDIELSTNIHPILVSVGRHSKEKGYIRLVDILAELKEEGFKFQCWLVGDGPEHNALVEKVKEMKLEKQIIFTGAQTNPHKYTAKADIFICSSFSEGYSTACTEAAALGIPIITTSVSGGEEIIEKAECGMLVDMDNNSLKNGLRTILNDKNLLKDWKLVAQKTSDKFSIDSMRKDVKRTFLELSNIK